jgi:hypothetical protein
MAGINISELTQDKSNQKVSRKNRTALSSLSDIYSNKEKKNEIGSEDYNFLKKELEKAKAELAAKVNSNHTSNEKKIISAIRSESINQDLSEPIITRSIFIKKYRVSSRFIDISIKKLIEQKEISRSEVDYTKKIKTYSYKIELIKQ